MKQTSENITVQLASPERKYVKVYHDFLRNELLTVEEKMVFIVLKSFVDFSKDNGGAQGEVYPAMDTICKLSSLSRPRATRAINKLIEKKIVKKIRRGLAKSNVYILADYATMWACDSTEDIGAMVDNRGKIPLTAEECMSLLEHIGYKVEVKKKGPASDSDQTTDTSTFKNNIDVDNHTTDKAKSQERYSTAFLRMHFQYWDLVYQNPDMKTDIDIIFNLLYDTLNTQKPTIRVNGEEKPAMVVIGRLMKLEFEDFPYAIEKYHEQTGRIKNVKAYLLTILYHAREQSHLDMMNLGHHNGAF